MPLSLGASTDNILLNGYVDNMVKNGAWRKYWLDPQKITQLREDLFDVLRYADRTGLLDPKIAGEGRGIVFAAGNSVRCLFVRQETQDTPRWLVRC